MGGFSEAQNQPLLGLLRFSSITSFVCSGILVLNIFSDSKTKLAHAYQRLLLGLSLCDMISAFNTAQAGWVAKYNVSCQINGLLSHFHISCGLYNAMLCLHFLLVICYKWTPRQFREQRYVEWGMHLISVGWPLSFGIAGVAVQAFGPIAFVPKVCSYDKFPEGRCETCRMVPEATILQLCGQAVPIVISFLIILYAMVRIFTTVFRQDRRQMAYQFQGHPQFKAAEETRVSQQPTQRVSRISIRNSIRLSLNINAAGRRERQLQQKRYQRCKESAKQAGLFIFAHLVTYTAILASFVILMKENPYEDYKAFQLSAVVCVFWPLQGLWNLIIYARPRYQNLKHKHPDMSFLVILFMSIWQRSNDRGGVSCCGWNYYPKKKTKRHDIAVQQDEFSSRLSNRLSQQQVPAALKSGALTEGGQDLAQESGDDVLNPGPYAEDDPNLDPTIQEEDDEFFTDTIDENFELSEDSSIASYLSDPTPANPAQGKANDEVTPDELEVASNGRESRSEELYNK